MAIEYYAVSIVKKNNKILFNLFTICMYFIRCILGKRVRYLGISLGDMGKKVDFLGFLGLRYVGLSSKYYLTGLHQLTMSLG